MLENLINLVKEHAGSAIINNPAIPNERNDEAVADASHSIIDGLKNAVGSGSFSDLAGMFGNAGNAGSGTIAQNIQSNFSDILVNKFGLNAGQADSTAASLIPSVLEKLVHKTNDPNDNSFDLNGILGHLTQGSGINVEDILSKFTGGGGVSGIFDSIKNIFNGK
jgi:hypothetical protein